MDEPQTLSEAVEHAKSKGYTSTFKMEDDGLRCLDSGAVLKPGDVTIVDHRRFEGASSEDDASVLYYIECTNGLKGIIVDAYGTYADEKIAEFIRKVAIDEDH